MSNESKKPDYFADLEKIANETILSDDIESEPMTEDHQPSVEPEVVEETQLQNAEQADADDMHPTSPEDTAALETSVAEAGEGLEEAKQVTASSEASEEEMEKEAQKFNEMLPEMASLAKLIEFSTNEEIDESVQKLASERLIQAMNSVDDYNEVIEKTAQELFQDEENQQMLYTQDGIDYVMTQLASFAEDEELEKIATDMGSIFPAIRSRVSEAVDAARNLKKISNEVKAADEQLTQLRRELTQSTQTFNAAQKSGDNLEEIQDLGEKTLNLTDDFKSAQSDSEALQRKYKDGQLLAGGTFIGGAGGGLYAGKKIHDRMNKDPDDELLERNASGTISQEELVHETKGGNYKMADTFVNDSLKIAGAAYLLDAAHDERNNEELRKEASETFNQIARMSRSDMDDNFIKVATTVYPEEKLHEIVAGQYNDELFEKVAWFTEVDELPLDELEKRAGAESVAAKSVGGALSDSKKNIEEKIEADKVKTETKANGKLGTKKHDDMDGYSVINNPGNYKVEKTASESLIEQAQMEKQAAFNRFAEMDKLIREHQSREA